MKLAQRCGNFYVIFDHLIICPNSDAMDSYWSKTYEYVGIINSMAIKFICAHLYLGVWRNENSLLYWSLFAENVTSPIILLYGNGRGTELSFSSYLISQDYVLVRYIYFQTSVGNSIRALLRKTKIATFLVCFFVTEFQTLYLSLGMACPFKGQYIGQPLVYPIHIYRKYGRCSQRLFIPPPYRHEVSAASLLVLGMLYHVVKSVKIAQLTPSVPSILTDEFSPPNFSSGIALRILKFYHNIVHRYPLPTGN